MASTLWIVPIGASQAEVSATVDVCEQSRIRYAVTPAITARERLSEDRPAAAVVHGGPPSPYLVDTQRWLAEAGIPTLVLLTHLTEDLEAVLLDRGAQDVVSLPASPRRLGSRLRAITRVAAPPDPSDDITVRGGITLSAASRTVDVRSTPVQLTKSEFDFLLAVASRRGSIASNDDLAEALGHDEFSSRALQTHASRIRAKLRAAGAPDVISSVRGIGYRLSG